MWRQSASSASSGSSSGRGEQLYPASGRSRVFADIDSTDASKRVVKARVDLLTSVAFNALETYFLVARNIRIGDADTLGELRIHLA